MSSAPLYGLKVSAPLNVVPARAGMSSGWPTVSVMFDVVRPLASAIRYYRRSSPQKALAIDVSLSLADCTTYTLTPARDAVASPSCTLLIDS